MKIRKAVKSDRDEWVRLRQGLWSEMHSNHFNETTRYFLKHDTGITDVFVLEHPEQSLIGYIELNIRNYAEGSQATAIPYIEAWYIESPWRQKGLGKSLLIFAEQWAKEQGYSELASDSLINNRNSIATHKALGFNEVERIVCFIKKL